MKKIKLILLVTLASMMFTACSTECEYCGESAERTWEGDDVCDDCYDELESLTDDFMDMMEEEFYEEMY